MLEMLEEIYLINFDSNRMNDAVWHGIKSTKSLSIIMFNVKVIDAINQFQLMKNSWVFYFNVDESF